ncbi:MAG: glycosyltransferase family 4 protein [Candidatus Obscuribacterales bacterium]|nr:glycosyltransferase family 4 protein [Candidatus Obscuribacterales bacterium]
MRIGFIGYPSSRLSGSGTEFSIVESFRALGHEVVELTPKRKFFTRVRLFLKREFYDLWGRGSYWTSKDPGLLKETARSVEKQVVNLDLDCIVSYLIPYVADLDLSIPVILWPDICFQSLSRTYSKYSNLSVACRSDAIKADQAAFEVAAKIIFPSSWAASEAAQYHPVIKEKVEIVPYGPNLNRVPDASSVFSRIEDRDLVTLNLLFVGVEVERKGLDLAVELARKLNLSGIPCKLGILGLDKHQFNDEFIVNYGFLNKQEHEAKIAEIYMNADILVMPSRAEAYGLVVDEAAAFGLPSIVSRVGGLAERVVNGKFGWAFSLETFVEDAFICIKQLLLEPSVYRAASRSARERFDNEMSWETSARKVLRLIEKTRANWRD